MNKETIARVQGFGFQVYMIDESKTWLIFTDGKNLGYLEKQNEYSGVTLSTVHKANRTSGTGFQVERHKEGFDKSDLEHCFWIIPPWAGQREAASVQKFRDIEEYRARDSWNAAYKLVPDVAPIPGKTETRFIKANVRKEGAQGSYHARIFQTTVPITGSYHIMAEAAIADIRRQGWETQNILAHSTKRELL